jgi:hypothetical protein
MPPGPRKSISQAGNEEDAVLLTRHLHETDPDLARLAAAWPDLPEHVKQTILALVNAVARPKG